MASWASMSTNSLYLWESRERGSWLWDYRGWKHGLNFYRSKPVFRTLWTAPREQNGDFFLLGGKWVKFWFWMNCSFKLPWQLDLFPNNSPNLCRKSGKTFEYSHFERPQLEGFFCRYSWKELRNQFKKMISESLPTPFLWVLIYWTWFWESKQRNLVFQ